MANGGKALHAPQHPPGSHLKGGGLRGGPKRWTGGGPRPARHIPWPEIFKHHISVVEGHLKMIDMIRKHTVPNTGNWRTINQMVERAQEMLRMSKDATRSFVPPPNHREAVPIGSSSASMYPGYSPADHQYGEAAQEFGSEWSAAKAKGIDFNVTPDGPQYELGQARGVKKRTLAQIRAAKAARGEGSGSGTGSGSDAGTALVAPNGTGPSAQPDAKKTESQSVGDVKDDGNPYFVIDVNPTLVNIPGVSAQPAKRASEAQPETEPIGDRVKKSKTKHEGPFPQTFEKKVEFEDISAEVDVRLKEKEAKRKQKEEKKRKRDSEESAVVEAVAETSKPKKKKSKIAGQEEAITKNGVERKKRRTSTGDETGEEESKPKKKKSKKGKQ